MSLRNLAPFLTLISLIATGCSGGDGDSNPPGSDGGLPGSDGGLPGSDGGPPPSCPAPPAGVSADARTAYDVENGYRMGMGIGCATMVETINTAAKNHCVYFVNATGECVTTAHQEVQEDSSMVPCPNFTGEQFWDRMTYAGYPGSPAFEGMAFAGDGRAAMEQLVHSVWHRTPILSPWIRDMGYGASGLCDTVDFGRGQSTPSDVVATFPYDGQVDVPRLFNGQFEGPTPPMPPAGWPSGYPVHVYAKGATITTHTLTEQGSATPIAHIWITPGGANDPSMLLRDEHVLYANEPLDPATAYRVQIQGTYIGGSLDLDFTFVTE